MAFFCRPHDLQVLEGDLGRGKVDQHVAGGDHAVQVVGNRDPQFAATGDQAHILAHQRVARTLQRAGEPDPVCLDDGIDDALAHTAGSAANGDFYHGKILTSATET